MIFSGGCVKIGPQTTSSGLSACVLNQNACGRNSNTVHYWYWVPDGWAFGMTAGGACKDYVIVVNGVTGCLKHRSVCIGMGPEEVP